MTGQLRTAAEAYLVMRRTLGFKLTTWGTTLTQFIGYCEARGIEHITTEVAVAWACDTPRGGSDEVWLSRRLMVVRIFARHLAALDPATEVPPADVLPHHKRRSAPYLYSPEQITGLLTAAGELTPPLRAATWTTLVGLLAVTGMRISEARRLDREHVDLDAATVLILDSKFGKSRQLFLHPTAVAALRDYVTVRDRVMTNPKTDSFFVTTRGTRPSQSNAEQTFSTLLDMAGITAPPGRRRPHIHDMRHSFTIATLLDLYRDGGDVQSRLPIVSTWLGHVDPKSTYWYMEAVPELLTLAAGRLETAFGESS